MTRLRWSLALLMALLALAAGTPAQSADGSWTFVGPKNIGGRVVDLAMEPRTNRLFAATAGGGMWVSSDRGRRWQFSGKGLPATIGAVAISRSGRIYAGTGEAFPGNGGLTHGGDGVYRSDDGGRTWVHVGLRGSERIGRIAIDPRDERRVFVAATGPGFKPGGERGLYQSTDAGNSWRLVLAGDNATTGAVDVVVDPRDGSRVYAAMWDRIRRPDRRDYFGVGSGLFRSVDGGRTWQRTALPWLAPSPALGRIAVGVAPSDPSRVYASASTVQGAHAGLFVSDDHGATFVHSPRAAERETTLFTGARFGRVSVDPRDKNHVLLSLVALLQSPDGGATWVKHQHTKLHGDHTAVVWDSSTKGSWWVAGDGGVFRTSNNGATFDAGQEMPWTQLYSVDVSARDPRRVAGGAQDVGMLRSWDDSGRPTSRWEDVSAGTDGTTARIDPSDHDTIYICDKYNRCSRSRNGGNDMEPLGARDGFMSNWVLPLELDPKNSGTLYSASESVHRSDDRGKTWRTISPRLSGAPGLESNAFFYPYATVSTVAPTGAGSIYAGTDDGRVWATHDGGSNWTQSAGIPALWVNRIRADPRKPRTAYAAVSGYRVGDERPYLFRTTDGAKTWSSVSGNLPRGQVNDVAILEDRIVVATDAGVFSSTDTKRWRSLGRGFPTSPVTELTWDSRRSSLHASTFGRGIWMLAV